MRYTVESSIPGTNLIIKKRIDSIDLVVSYIQDLAKQGFKLQSFYLDHD